MTSGPMSRNPAYSPMLTRIGRCRVTDQTSFSDASRWRSNSPAENKTMAKDSHPVTRDAAELMKMLTS